jgi:hypothetical protein
MFFGPGDPDCEDCTPVKGFTGVYCTMNCGPVARRLTSKGEEMTERVESTSDERTVNNAVRHTYRVLSDAEKAQVQAIKDLGADFIEKLHEIGGTNSFGDRFASRDLSLANTHAEDAVMRAVRHITA